jgi:hypothetical protein
VNRIEVSVRLPISSFRTTNHLSRWTDERCPGLGATVAMRQIQKFELFVRESVVSTSMALFHAANIRSKRGERSHWKLGELPPSIGEAVGHQEVRIVPALGCGYWAIVLQP